MKFTQKIRTPIVSMYLTFHSSNYFGILWEGFTIKKIGMTYYIWPCLASKKGVKLQEKDLLCESNGYFWVTFEAIFFAALRQGQDVVHHEGSIRIASSYIQLQELNTTSTCISLMITLE